MKKLTLMVGLMFTFLFTFFAFSAIAQVVAINPDQTFLAQVLGLIGTFGGLSWVAKVSSICLVIVALTKTSFIAPLWAKLPPLLQTLAAPILGLIGGLIGQGSLTWASALAYVTAGAGAIVLHEILDGIKGIPGIGATYVAIITLIEGFLGGPGPTAPTA
jgi:hypothetical protein